MPKYEFPVPIKVTTNRVVKKDDNIFDLHLDKKHLYVKNWSISMKQLAKPVWDEKRAMLILENLEGSKKFECCYKHISTRTFNRLERYPSLNYSVQPPSTLKNFVERIDAKRNLHERKKMNHNHKESASYGSTDWVNSSSSKKAKRVYGGRSYGNKKIRRNEKLLELWNLDEMEEREEKHDPNSRHKNQIEVDSLLPSVRTPQIGETEKENVRVKRKRLKCNRVIRDDVSDDDTEFSSFNTTKRDDGSMDDECSKPLITSNNSNEIGSTVSDPTSVAVDHNPSLQQVEEDKTKLGCATKKRLNTSRDEKDDSSDGSIVFLSGVSKTQNTDVGAKPLQKAFVTEGDTMSVVTDEEDVTFTCSTNRVEADILTNAKQDPTSTSKLEITSYFQPKLTPTVKAKLISKANIMPAAQSIVKQIPAEKLVLDNEDDQNKLSINLSHSPSHTEASNRNELMSATKKYSPKSNADRVLTPLSCSSVKGGSHTTPSQTVVRTITPTIGKGNIDTFLGNHATSKSATTARPVQNNYKPSFPPGLTNLGNTCYLNASLQLLFSLPLFFNSLITHEKQHQELKLLRSLVELYQTTRRPTTITPSAAKIKECIDTLSKRFVGFEQRDAHEFVSDLLDLLHDELSKTNDNSKGKEDRTLLQLPTDAFFCMKVKVCLKCDSCGYTRSKVELYRHLSLDVQGDNITLQEALKRFFAPEKREICCEKCENGKSATQTMEVVKMPKALLLHLKRFIWTTKTTAATTPNDSSSQVVFRKNPIAVEYPRQFSPFDGGKDYQLCSLVHHIGSTASSGHYTTDGLRESGKKWLRFDDRLVREIPYGNVNCDKNRRDVYMLLYYLLE